MYFFPEHPSMLPADPAADHTVIGELVVMLRRAVTRQISAIRKARGSAPGPR